MIVAVGTDLVDVGRLAAHLERVPALAHRLFTPAELAHCAGRADSLAARLAAKESALKALGTAVADHGWDIPPGWAMVGIEVVSGSRGEPHLALHGVPARLADELGITGWHLSLAHDGGMAQAFVVATADTP